MLRHSAFYISLYQTHYVLRTDKSAWFLLFTHCRNHKGSHLLDMGGRCLWNKAPSPKAVPGKLADHRLECLSCPACWQYLTAAGALTLAQACLHRELWTPTLTPGGAQWKNQDRKLAHPKEVFLDTISIYKKYLIITKKLAGHFTKPLL